ncbi:PTS glucose transporter subunit IIA [Kocuria rhizophila]|uniref:PTS sugar transporter subunit IIA n=1 Tax=Kocuria rhizophila TaxID=72000 RepID=UPI00386D2EDB|nr:PTS glucose transporter subunit IIA [Kocuria rhizophila]WSZ53427.1 PTS glucose transporter subunit IIA [Kocuria rhizophila]
MSGPETLTVQSPLAGTLLELGQVPDPVFAQGMVGHGVAMEPAVGDEPVTVLSPVAGKLLKVMPHAFVVLAPSGLAVLVHLGIDTVKLEGEGFTVRAHKGDPVEAGDPVVEMDLSRIREAGLSACCPVVVLDSAADAITSLAGSESIAAGQDLFAVHQ